MKRATIILSVAFLLVVAFASFTRLRQYSPDSMNYVDVARHVLEGNGLVQSAMGYNDGRFLGSQEWPNPYIAQPPLYPLAIAALGWFGIEPADGALAWPVIALGVILLAGSVVGRRLGGETGGWLVPASLLWLLPLVDASRRAWSDGLGTAIVVLTLVGLVTFLQRERVSARSWFGLGLLAGLGFATRYVLLPLVGMVVLAALVRERGDVRSLVRATFAAGLGAAIPVMAVLLRNVSASGGLMPALSPSTVTTMDACASALATMGAPWTLVAVASVMILCLAGERLKGEGMRPKGLWVFAVWVVVYLAMLIAQRTRVHFDDLTPRLLLPATVPAVIALAAWVGRAWGDRWKRAIPALALVAVASACGRELLPILRSEPFAWSTRVEASPRLVLVRDGVREGDLVIGNDVLDVVFYLGHRNVISFSPFPYTAHPDYDALMTYLDAHPERARNPVILFRDFTRGNRERLLREFGPFIVDLLEGRLDAYPRIKSVGVRGDTYVFQIDG